MTYQEWLTSDDPQAMLEFARHNWMLRDERGDLLPPTRKLSDRKLWLFACACARQVWHLLTDNAPCELCKGYGVIPFNALRHQSAGQECYCCSGTGRINRSRRAVEVAEWFADGMATEQELFAAWDAAIECSHEDVDQIGAMRCAYTAASRELPEQIFNPFLGYLAGLVPNTTQANLLRDIFGNPFHPVTLSHGKNCPSWAGPKTRLECGCVCDWLTWNDGLVRKLATTIYDERRFEDIPVLADALQEAGCEDAECEDAEILNHCRGLERCPKCIKLPDEINHPPGMIFVGWGHGWQPCLECGGSATINAHGTHVRGCWVIDLLLGKS